MLLVTLMYVMRLVLRMRYQNRGHILMNWYIYISYTNPARYLYNNLNIVACYVRTLIG